MLYPFTKQMVDGAPLNAGVYALHQNGVLIYIGRAMGGLTTIRSRLQDHYSGREGACTQRASHYEWDICADPATRERQLLNDFKQRVGRLPRCNDVMP